MSKQKFLLPIFLIVLVDIFGFTLVIPLLAIYAEHFGATPLQATLLVTTYAACQLISGPILGRWSDRIGRKPILLLSQLGTLIGFLIMARAEMLWVLFVARAIDGLTAGNLTIAQAYISDNTEPQHRAKAFGVIGIAFGLGFFVGPFVTGQLATYGLAAPIYLAAGLSLTSILCTWLLLPKAMPIALAQGATPTARVSVFSLSGYLPYLKRPILNGILFQFFCYTFSFSVFTSGFALFAERTFSWHDKPFGPREIGYLFAYVGFLGIMLQGGLIGRLVKRFGEPALVVSGFITLAVGYMLLGAVHQVGTLVAVATLLSFGNGVLRPALTSLLTQRAGKEEQGVVLGINQSLNALGQSLAPVASGFLIGSQHLTQWAWVAAAASLLGWLGARVGSSKA